MSVVPLERNNSAVSDQRKILIADDDPGIVDALSLILEEFGYEIDVTLDGTMVQQVVLQQNPDLLILDIWMSGQDGRDICKKLKSDERTTHIPIILCSANRDTGTIAAEAGANDSITKPFEMDDLLAKVEKWIAA